MAAGPSRIRSRLTQSRAIRRRAADRACHVGSSRSSLEASQCPLETMKLSNYLWSHPKGCSEAVHALATKSVTLKEHGPQHVLRRRMMRLPPFNRAVASLLSIHCCCCCHLSRLVRFLFSSGCLLSSLSHRHVKTVCVSKTGGTEERSCSAALVASTAQSSV